MYVKLLKDHKKILALIGLLAPVLILTQIIIPSIREQKRIDKIEGIISQAEIRSNHRSYQLTDQLEFTLDLKQNLNISYHPLNIINKALAQTGNQADKFYLEDDLVIRANVINTNTKEQHPVDFNIQKESSTIYNITGKNTSNTITPGSYQLKVSVDKAGAKGSITQDFTWGVLAINTTKSVYTPGDSAKIHLAVLDEKGGMVCDAQLELSIIDPAGNTTSLSTEDGSIIKNPECELKDLVTKPDYETAYNVELTGTYQLRLKAITQNGEYEITDTFQSQTTIPFDVERISATRIYPVNKYPVIFKVTPRTDYKGIFRDYAPSFFETIDLERKLFDEFALEYFGQTGLPYQQPANITTDYPVKTIQWEVDWAAGETYYLAYQYDSPNASPQFYLLGPAAVGSLFAETRQWQIAVDEADVGEWWDGNYRYRKQLTVTTDSTAPFKGYDGYTVRFSMDTSTDDSKFEDDCDDLRIAHWNGSGWDELPRHIIGNNCNDGTSDVRFMLQADIDDSSTDDNYYVYYGYSSAGTPTALGTENVYLWYDDASSDRSSSYIFGRCDAWHGSGYTAWSYDSSDSYDIDTGDNYTGCMRRPIDERDAYIEAEMYHTGCYNNDMTSGLIGRYILNSGSGSTEDASHYYASNRGDSPSCQGEYSHDGDILEGARTSTAITRGSNPASITWSQWRKQALAIWGVNNTNGKFWDNDTATSLGPSGWPSAATLTSGSDTTDQEGSGDWGIVAAQDVIDMRNLMIRRYTEPEPSISQGPEERVITVSGRIYTDEGTSPLDCTTSRTVAIKVNGVGPRNAECSNTPVNGTYSINGVLVSSGDTLTVFIDNESEDATTVTLTDGTTDLTGVDLYQNHIIVRHDYGTSLDIDDMTYYDNNDDGDIAFTAEDSSPDTLTVNDGHELYVWSGDTFTPGGNLTVDDIKIVGTYTATGTESITVSGTWNHSGTFTAANSTVYFDAGSTTEDIFTTGSGAFNNLEFDDSGGGATWEVEDPLDIDGNLTVTSGSIDVVSGEDNQINVAGNYSNDGTLVPRSGTVVLDGASDTNLDSGCSDADTCTNEDFYNLTIQKDEDAKVTLANTHLRVSNLLNIVTGWLIQAALNIRAEGTTAIDVDDFGRWENTSTGNVTLGGNVINDGNITLNANGMSCGDADSITIASTAAASRSWSGAGGFRIVDVAVSYQTGSAVIYAASSTNNGDMGANWRFVQCNEFHFEGLDFEGLDVD